MLESTYADKAFSDNIAAISDALTNIAASQAAIANHLAVLTGIVKQKFLQPQLFQTDKEGFIRPV